MWSIYNTKYFELNINILHVRLIKLTHSLAISADLGLVITFTVNVIPIITGIYITYSTFNFRNLTPRFATVNAIRLLGEMNRS